MPVIYAMDVKTGRMDVDRQKVLNGTLEILTAADALIVAHTLTASAGSTTDDIWTIGLVTNVVAATGSGTAAKARIKDSLSAVKISGLTVGEATGVPATEPDVIVQNVSINAGQNVDVQSATVKHAPDPA